jgi:hypothetical protein
MREGDVEKEREGGREGETERGRKGGRGEQGRGKGGGGRKNGREKMREGYFLFPSAKNGVSYYRGTNLKGVSPGGRGRRNIHMSTESEFWREVYSRKKR